MSFRALVSYSIAHRVAAEQRRRAETLTIDQTMRGPAHLRIVLLLPFLPLHIHSSSSSIRIVEIEIVNMNSNIAELTPIEEEKERDPSNIAVMGVLVPETVLHVAVDGRSNQYKATLHS